MLCNYCKTNILQLKPLNLLERQLHSIPNSIQYEIQTVSHCYTIYSSNQTYKALSVVNLTTNNQHLMQFHPVYTIVVSKFINVSDTLQNSSSTQSNSNSPFVSVQYSQRRTSQRRLLCFGNTSLHACLIYVQSKSERLS